MSKIAKLTDYSVLEGLDFGDFESEENIIDALLNIDMKSVIVLPDKIDDEEKEEGLSIVKYYNNKWMTQKYVGVLQFDDKQICIGSRFDEKDTYNFTNYVISKALGIKTLLFKEQNPTVGNANTMEQLLIFVFIDQINTAFKSGMFRKYVKYEKNDDKVKGTIDIAMHIKLNPLFCGKIAYSYREYTADNDVNKLILTAFDMVEKRNKSLIKSLINNKKNVKDCISQLRNITTPASRQEVQNLLKHADKKIAHSVYKAWEKVRLTAIMLLRHLGVHIAKTDKKRIHGVLIDMNYMWEKYLENIFSKSELISDWKLKPQQELGAAKYNECYNRILKPDFVWLDKDEYKFILDAKYKNKWSNLVSGNVSSGKKDYLDREDFFQICAYMLAFRCKKSGIVCPGRSTAKTHGPYIVSDKCDDHDFFVFTLEISSKTDYSDFVNEMSGNEEKLLKELKNYIIMRMF